MWEETFKTHTDRKPHGPESLGLDATFHHFGHVFGLPQHADAFALRSTAAGDPYRLYNLDVFEYELNSPMALYGSIPFMLAHSANFSVGLLWLNAAETWVDIASTAASSDGGLLATFSSFMAPASGAERVDTHWFSESGVIDVYLVLGPTPNDLFRQYGKSMAEMVGHVRNGWIRIKIKTDIYTHTFLGFGFGFGLGIYTQT